MTTTTSAGAAAGHLPYESSSLSLRLFTLPAADRLRAAFIDIPRMNS